MVLARVLHNPKVILKTPALHEFTHFKPNRQESVILNSHQKTNFIRDVIFEELFHSCKVYSLNNCTDEVRNSNTEHVDEMNMNINRHTFVSTMNSKNWKFDQLIVDHFRMYDSYFSSNINPGFFLI